MEVQLVMKLKILLVVPLLVGFVAGQNLLDNGDFEQVLSTGWTTSQGGLGSHIVERLTYPDPDPDYEAHVRQYDGSGFTKLLQLVDVAGPDLEFSFWASWNYGNGSSTCWPVASVFLEYYDHRGLWMGETRWYYHSVYCNWQSASNRNLINISDPGWMQYTLNVQQELEDNLPGVNAANIRKVGVALYSYTSGG